MPATYKVGAAKADITDKRSNLVLAGFAYEKQKTNGSIDLSLFARAFVIEENRSSPRHLCLVVIDAWSAAEPLKSEVLKKLRTHFGSRYTDANLVLSATHTHAGPGGYSHHMLYNLTTGGHDTIVMNKMVAGIVKAVRDAEAAKAPGKIYVAQRDLAGCGDNRSVDAYRANPEGQAADAYDKRTDRQMTVMRFTQESAVGEKEIGLYSIFAIHPTNLGTFNVEVSGDNKGWAAKFCEDAKSARYVAAFANANAGDVSPNVSVSAAWVTTFEIPKGGPTDAPALAANKAAMKIIARKQSNHALTMVEGPMTELTGRLGGRCKFVDMANVVMGTKRTAKAAIGVSFAAGSHEDGIALATFDVLGLDFNIEPEISEGTNNAAFAAGKQATKAIAGTLVTNSIANDESLLGVMGSASLLALSGKLDNVRADPLARSWVFGTWARALFPSEVESHDPQPSGGHSWEWNVPHSSNWPAAYMTGHGAKPIVFPAGLAELKRGPGPHPIIKQPLVPHKVPLQVVRIGSLVMAAMPHEFTTVAGYRLKKKAKAVFGAQASYVALVGYANDYAFYVTTPEEYALQHYEGASTLYGPHTLAACLQEVGTVATSLKNETALSTGTPDVPAAIYYRT